MGRRLASALAAIGMLVIAGCGSDSAAVRAPVEARAAVAVADVEPTDGRLGEATLQRADEPQLRLSPGGPPDATERGDAPRRDGVGAGAACPNADLVPTAATLTPMAEATLCLVNGERADRGLAPLSGNARLADAATAYAQDLVAGQYFSHTGRDGSGVLERIKRSGYVPRGAAYVLGENLAWGSGALATPGAIVNAWMNSPGHRDNILNPDFREMGVGVVRGNPRSADGRGATYATEFGAIEGVVEVVPGKARKGARRAGKARRARAASARGGKRRGARAAG
jgi:uncharacterized protein YkwD